MRNDLYIEREAKVSSEVCTPLGYAERIYRSARPLNSILDTAVEYRSIKTLNFSFIIKVCKVNAFMNTSGGSRDEE